MLERGKLARGVMVALFIALAGPLIGTLVFTGVPLTRMLIASADQNVLPNAMSEWLYVVLFFVLYGYLFGGLAAMLSGAVLGWVTMRRGTFGYGLALLVGALSGGVSGLVLGTVALSSDGLTPGLAVFLSPIAAAAALICRWLMGFFGVLPRAGNVSLAKP